MSKVDITISNVTKFFGNIKAVDGVSLHIEAGELFFLLGPSGCGKTTLLRCVAGFHEPDAGILRIGTENITHLPPYKRQTAMVFQNYALWPHLTIARNVAFGLEMRGVGKTEIRRRIMEALAMVKMEHRADARPNQLSGGQQQRVALARALVTEPRCLLLDEPLSNLDAKLRMEMREEIRGIVKTAGLTAIYVTHDQKEALSIADRIAVMREGKIEQAASPEILYRQPKNRFIAGFVGEINLLQTRVLDGDGEFLLLDSRFGKLKARKPNPAPSAGASLEIGIRPEAVRLPDGDPAANPSNILSGTLRHSVYQGETARHELWIQTVDGSAMPLNIFELNPRRNARGDEAIPTRAWIDPDDIIPLP